MRNQVYFSCKVLLLKLSAHLEPLELGGIQVLRNAGSQKKLAAF